jgi:hypothetical protein
LLPRPHRPRSPAARTQTRAPSMPDLGPPRSGARSGPG